MAQIAQSIVCELCKSEFRCDPAGDCWCKQESLRLPMPTSSTARCLCPECLRKATTPKS